MPAETHYRMNLNNYLQARHGSKAKTLLTWECEKTGLEHKPSWVAIAKLDDVEWGSGTGTSLDAAKEAAAAAVLDAIHAEGPSCRY